VARYVQALVDLADGVEQSLTPVRRRKQIFSGFRHPRCSSGQITPLVRPLSNRYVPLVRLSVRVHGPLRASGGGDFPSNGRSNHHERSWMTACSGAVDRHPQVVRKKAPLSKAICFVSSSLQVISRHHESRTVPHRPALSYIAAAALYAATPARDAAVQAAPGWFPAGQGLALVTGSVPQSAMPTLDATDDHAGPCHVVLTTLRISTRVREFGVPASGAEGQRARTPAVGERLFEKRVRGADEVVESRPSHTVTS